MKILTLLLVVAGLSGCIAVPVVEPAGAYYGPPAAAVVIGPPVWGYYGYRGGYRDGDRHRWH